MDSLQEMRNVRIARVAVEIADDAARADVNQQRQIGAADEHADTVDDVDEIDIGRRVVDLTDIERPWCMDVARPGF